MGKPMLQYRVEKTGVLVIGAGITGLRAAMEASRRERQVLVLSKGPRCSWGIGGFAAAAGADDSTELYYQDILASGCGISDKKLDAILAEGSMKEVRLLEERGMTFDHREDGGYDLLRPLGCTVPRLVHHASKTGTLAEEIFLKVLAERNVEVREGVTVVELLSDGERVYGALGVDRDGGLTCWQAKAVVMAAGGCGAMYPVTTYPAGLQGDSYGMLIRAGSEMIDMEFMQFEPCCLVEPAAMRGRGISTTMLSAGAVLRNAGGEEFLLRYFDSLAQVQKGELSRAIYAESRRYGGAPVEYDLTPLTPEEIDAHCIFSQQLRDHDYDAAVKPLKILPAAHTFLGGARVDTHCAASLEGLYAAGEAMGGLHGANRIGGCAGAETFVFGAVAGRSAGAYAAEHEADAQKALDLADGLLAAYAADARADAPDAAQLDRVLHETMVEKLYIIRDAAGIAEAAKTAAEVERQARALPRTAPEQLMNASRIENAALILRMIAEVSALRKESRGVFFRSDYPARDDAHFMMSFTAKKSGDAITVGQVDRS